VRVITMLNRQPLMQRFTLSHDGSSQGWQTAYLAFDVAARLGAPLQVLLLDSTADQELLAQNAMQLQTAGRAAGVSLETRIVADFSSESVARSVVAINGLFLPHRLLPDEETTTRLLEALACPLWIVAGELRTRKMAVLVENLTGDQDLIAYAMVLSQRMSERLTALILNEQVFQRPQGSPEMAWMPLQDFSEENIIWALDQLHADLLCIKDSKFFLARRLGRTCLVYPTVASA
jgi:hypothetical protein